MNAQFFDGCDARSSPLKEPGQPMTLCVVNRLRSGDHVHDLVTSCYAKITYLLPGPQVHVLICFKISQVRLLLSR